jgi:hypothetical protein
MPRSEERGGLAACSKAEGNSLLVYKSSAWKDGVLYFLACASQSARNFFSPLSVSGCFTIC